MEALFFDANGDKKLDLYVVSGGYHSFLPDDAALQDRLYLNDGKGNFTKSTKALPVMRTSGSCVRATDVNADGALDLFVGGRVIPGRYPETPRSYLLINNGKGQFTDQTANLAPGLQKLGLVTDAAWHDLNVDAKPELVVVGEWMPITVFSLKSGKLTENTSAFFSRSYRGWWNKLLLADLNQDKRPDLLVGNQGLNTQCKATDREPAELYFKDFDDNGAVDPILCFYMQGKSYPYVTRDELLDQVSLMRTRFQDYGSYANATLENLFTAEELKGAGHLSVNYLQTAYFQGGSNGKFKEMKLPLEAQFSPVFALASVDANRDGAPEVLVGGNENKARLRFGKADANYGVLLQNDGKGNLTYVPQQKSGFKVLGDVRCILPIGDKVVFGVNQKPVKAYRILP
ncbi:MAG: FG-GAP repeat domain-containing protein [Rufibacter sp.]